MSVDVDWDSLIPAEDGDVPPEDLPADPRDGTDWPTCEVCGDSIDWTGRGRRPKKCAEHRRRTIVRGSDGPVTTRRSRAEDARLARIELSLAKQAIKVAAVTSRMLPVTGVTVANRAENAAAAIVKVCANKPEYLEVLEKVAAFEAAMELAEFVAAVVVAVGVDLGQVNPEGIPAQMLDVTAAWREVEGIEAEAEPVSVDPAPYVAEPVGDRHDPRPATFGPGLLPSFTPIGAGV